MKKITLSTLSVALLFLSFGVFSASSVYTVQDDTALRSDKSSNSKVLKVLVKDTRLQRLTMHYSGWSKVDLKGLNGWVLSSHLTKTMPENTRNIVAKSGVKSDNSKYIKQINNLKESLEKSQLKNKNLSSEIVDIKVLNAESTNKTTADFDSLEQKNNELSTYNNDLQSQLDSVDTDNNINTLFIFILGLIIGVIASVVIARSAQKKRDSFNTISRSY